MRPRDVSLLSLAVAVALGVTACGGEDREGSVEESGGSTTGETATTGTTATGTTPAAGGAPTATVKVRETEYEIDPENPRIAKAGPVSFRVRNAGDVAHSLEIEGPGGEVETEPIAPGRSATLKADLSRPGTYKWYCPIGDHERRGMTGKIVVAGGSRTGGDDSGKRDDSDKGGGRDAGKRPGANGGSSGGVY